VSFKKISLGGWSFHLWPIIYSPDSIIPEVKGARRRAQGKKRR
jgi:hypothetical protein